MAQYDLQRALLDANRERALIYLEIFREIKTRHGEQQAIDIIRSALVTRGKAFGETLKQYAPRDFRGLCDAFAYVPDGGKMFAPKEIRCDANGLELKMTKCPLKEAWVDAGVTDEELCTLLHCACAMDVGTLDAAGFDLEIKTWRPGESGCCSLKISQRAS